MNQKQTYSGWKKIVLISLLGLAFIKIEKVKRPILGMSEKNISLGKISSKLSTDFSFTVYNWGTNQLNIDTIFANCTCAKFDYPKGTLYQNDSMLVKVTYQPEYLGEINNAIVIVSNSNTRFKLIQLSGQVVKAE
jgi:hypothetical protein